jgi:hypothetical protein
VESRGRRMWRVWSAEDRLGMPPARSESRYLNLGHRYDEFSPSTSRHYSSLLVYYFFKLTLIYSFLIVV